MNDSSQPDALVIGSGPAGLAAAEVLANAGHTVWLVDQMPSLGRKLLMAGKSGLNLTKEEPTSVLRSAVTPLAPQLDAALHLFDSEAVKAWAESHGQPVFTGSSGRVFPTAMKASPLLRSVLASLVENGTRLLPRWRWVGGLASFEFETPHGPVTVRPKATVLALGGASWPRLGSDGLWVKHLPTNPFEPSNMGFFVAWSPHMAIHFGAAIKNVALSVGKQTWRGEFVITARGVEGGGIYAASAALREATKAGAPVLTLDLFPDLTIEALAGKLARPQGKASLANHLRRTIGLSGARMAIIREAIGPDLPQGHELALLLKALPLRTEGPFPIREAISTAGGLRMDALTPELMLKDCPGVFAAGEMLDWEAPTGGYLITTCLATGRMAGQGAADWLKHR
ncbi:TIGR03862 family flavoprotein [Algicella marina]|uniref:TIGR03862 family flavoprotein n=1 Tax=Algicella marina TaxID=2683284 RepID=A0A6P1T5K6_9RHOB|nr:TIGR03862 family flavoprotein [Algicella marina]QHQ36736.1 TIGR03862 family flavoprotein [Algicella marina]